MLLKQLSKNNRIIAKDLLSTPVGMLCYVVDGLKAGRSIADIIAKIRKHKPSTVFEVDVSAIKIVTSSYQNISTINDVYNLC